jgi:NADH-quinone oxidoreductase subunit L
MMVRWLLDMPGRLYVVATLVPLAVFAAILLAGCLRALVRPYRENAGLGRTLYYFLGGPQPLRAGAYLATGAIALSATLAVVGLLNYLHEASFLAPLELEPRWSERGVWAHLGPIDATQYPATQLEIGYRIDHLTAILFAMVTVIATCIFVFSLGYMRDETEINHEDHEAHITRPGRYGRFFMFLSLFCFSMLNLLIADNLFQVFISWELVGVCSFFLIGFYHERPSAGLAANKAFIMNRIGDAGFLIGLAIVWTYFGTFNFQEISRDLANSTTPNGIPYYLLTIAGLGIFLGCVGKSAQFPLQTWLPDAMEGPTPVSALIHAATMVAAGVYLVGRAYPIFTPEARLIIAYTGMITLFLGATIALVQTDIKRVLAYSTVSQLGYMMLALGVGGWGAGLLHLTTHAFFKALLFLGSGSVIYGCHHEQDLRKMGGLFKKMPITALTMLIGVLAIIGTPFFSGWYSKDLILSNALGFAQSQPNHYALFIVPLVTAMLTAFYMFRLWFLAFVGEGRDPHVSEHAHESPGIMTIPLLVLSLFSVGIAWGWPIWEPHASTLLHLIQSDTARPGMTHGLDLEDHRAGWLALLAAGIGTVIAVLVYGLRLIDSTKVRRHLGLVVEFLSEKWYFDRLYQALFVAPTILFAQGLARFDKRTSPLPDDRADREVNLSSLDGVGNAIGQGFVGMGRAFRQVQSGLIRRYVMVLLVAMLVFAFFVAGMFN